MKNLIEQIQGSKRIQRTTKILLGYVLAVGSLQTQAQDIPVRIGLVAPMSGALAVTGRANEQGARLAIDELNLKNIKLGRFNAKFELVAEDDAGDPRQGLSAAQKLVDSGIQGVVGHQTSGSTIPASRLYSEAGIPQISPFTTSPLYTHQGFKTAFRLMPDDVKFGKTLGNYAVKNLGIKKFSVIDDRTSYGHGIAEEFSRAVIAAGGTVVEREYFTDKSIDFSMILTAIRATRPDAIFVGGMYAAAGPMLRQMKQLGMPMKILGGDGICDDELLKLAGGTLHDAQVLCAGPAEIEPGRMQNFNMAFLKKFGLASQTVSAYSYDAVNLIANAMQRANSADPKRYLPLLATTRDYPGVTGNISFDQNGDLLQPKISLYTFKNARRSLVTTVQAQ